MPVLGGLEAGRYNAVASFQKWLKENLVSPLAQGGLDSALGFTVQFSRPIATMPFGTGPVVAVTDSGLFQGRAVDVDDVVATDSSGNPVRAKEGQTLLEIAIMGSKAVRPDERARIFRLRDAILRLYRLAGIRSGWLLTLFAGPPIVPEIKVFDFESSMGAPTATNNFLRRDRDANWLTEGPMDDPAHPEIEGWRGLLRIRWWEFYSP